MKLPLLLLILTTLLVPQSSAQNGSPLVEWIGFGESLEAAEKDSKKVLVDIFAPWCGWCSKMQGEAYHEPEILEYLKQHFVATRIDISIETDTLSYNGYDLPSAQMAAGFGASGTPTTVFLDSDGGYITRLPGYAKPDEFLQVLRFIASEAYVDQSYAEFVESVDR